MRIVCPSCGAAYEVAESRLAPGKPVRCSRCTTTWAPLDAKPEPKPEQPRLEERLVSEAAHAVPVPDPAPRAAQAVPRWTRMRAQLDGRAPLAAAWAVSFLVLAAVIWGAYAWRDDVMRAWPASERAYSALGLRARK